MSAPRKEVLADGVEQSSKIKAKVGCRACDWVWKPYSGRTREACPNCGVVRDVRNRNGEKKPNLEKLKEWRAARPGYSTAWERRYRLRALTLVGRGTVACVSCGCDRPELLEINHINGGGGKEHRSLKRQFHRLIASLSRSVDDLNLLCRPCNSVHGLELKHGKLPFKITWCSDEN